MTVALVLLDAARSLKTEPDRHSRAQVREAQRARLLAAMAQVAAERGMRGATLARVTARARVSGATFYECFENPEACFLAALDVAMRGAMKAIDGALRRKGLAHEKAAGALVALLGRLEDEPTHARLWLVAASAAGPAALAYRTRELELLRHALDAACAPAAGDGPEAALAAEAAVAAVVGMLQTRLLTGEAPPFLELAESLAAVVPAPCLDAQALRLASAKAAQQVRALRAKRAARAARQPPAVEIPTALSNPLAHRARLCLAALDERPGASNRELAQAIGVGHAGQVSALLARLAGLGLLEKRAGRPGRPNEWRLSEYGARVAQALARGDTP